jgi:hypothetical protein
MRHGAFLWQTRFDHRQLHKLKNIAQATLGGLNLRWVGMTTAFKRFANAARVNHLENEP